MSDSTAELDSLLAEATDSVAAAERAKASGNTWNAWKWRGYADAFQPRDPLYYLVDGLLAAPSLNIWYGPPGSMKSMILADLAVCVTLGKPFLSANPNGKPGRTFITRQSHVAWIDMDNGRRRTDVRFDALGKAHGADANNRYLHYVSIPNPTFNAADDRLMSDFEQGIRNNDVKLLIVDNLGLSIGETDENKAEMAVVMRNFKTLAENCETCIVIIHHPTKGGVVEGARLGDKLRGHSTIEAALDSAMYIDRLEGREAISVIPTKVREYRIEAFGADFTYEHHEGTYDLKTAAFYSKPHDSPDEVRRRLLQDVILTVLFEQRAGSQVSRSDLYEKVAGIVEGSLGKKTPSRNEYRGQLTVLAELGFVAEGKEKDYMYSLSDKGWIEAQNRKVRG